MKISFLFLKKIDKKRFVLAIILILFGSIGRILLLDLPNVETLTIASLLAGSMLGGGYTLIVPLTIVAITDMYIGNKPILIFTWTAWAIIGILGWLLRKSKKESFVFGFKMMGMGVVSSLFFYVWTNFGVWLMWPQMYPATWQGLISCYILGLPFLKMNLIGNLIIIPATVFPLIFVLKYRKAILFKKAQQAEKTLVIQKK